jgi:8-oxo-dGTP pyrophosphatase MutT (NUDIX family)
MSLLDPLLRVAATGVHHLLRGFWRVRRPRTFGAHAIALTPQGKLVLVKLRYASGWRLPGGGREPGEDAAAAALRELREEIGMTDHGEVRLAAELEERLHGKRDCASLVIIRHVTYRPPRWSWEVERVTEAAPSELPPGTSPLTARWVAAVRHLL